MKSDRECVIEHPYNMQAFFGFPKNERGRIGKGGTFYDASIRIRGGNMKEKTNQNCHLIVKVSNANTLCVKGEICSVLTMGFSSSCQDDIKCAVYELGPYYRPRTTDDMTCKTTTLYATYNSHLKMERVKDNSESESGSEPDDDERCDDVLGDDVFAPASVAGAVVYRRCSSQLFTMLEVLYLAVHPNYRNQHVATTLVDALLKAKPDEHIKTALTVSIKGESEEALEFWKKVGMKPCKDKSLKKLMTYFEDFTPYYMIL